MKKYSITGNLFEGEIQLIFLNSELVKIDFLNAKLSNFQKDKFLKLAVIREVDLEDMRNRMSGCILVSDDYTITLDEFKKAYPYARNSHLLPPVWNKLSANEQVMAWLKAQDYARYCKRNDWYKPKIAAKWLKDREWLNDWNRM